MLMGNAMEFLREHVPSATRIHYIMTKGGVAPNIVPDDAEMFLYARHPSMPYPDRHLGPHFDCAKGAGQATETTVDAASSAATTISIDNSSRWPSACTKT